MRPTGRRTGPLRRGSDPRATHEPLRSAPPPPATRLPPASMLIYGRWPVLEALRAGGATAVYLQEGLRGDYHARKGRADVLAESGRQGVPVHEVDRAALEEAL